MCLLRACSSGRQSSQGSRAAWQLLVQDFGTAAFVLSSLSSFSRNESQFSSRKDLVWELQCRVNLPFSLVKQCILCSEKRYTSVGRTQEAGWQDAGYRNKLTQSLHLAAVLISSQAALTTYECCLGFLKWYWTTFKVCLFQNPLQTERRDGLTGADVSRTGWLPAPHPQWGLLWVETSGKDFVQENNGNTDRERPYAERETYFLKRHNRALLKEHCNETNRIFKNCFSQKQ